MDLKTAISKAIEGGWKGETTPEETVSEHGLVILLDPDFWRCLGKAMGWGKEPQENGVCKHCSVKTTIQPPYESGCNHAHYPEDCIICYENTENWKEKWHSLIDALSEGRSVEEFFDNLK